MTSRSTDFITAGELAKSLGLSYGTAKSILESTGTGEPIGNMRAYSRKAAVHAVISRYAKVLEFLDFNLSQSRDANV